MTPTWRQPPAGLELHRDEIHVWRTTLLAAPEEMASLEQTLDADERRRAERFVFRRDRERFVAAHGRLRLVLGRYLDRPAPLLRFQAGRYGKPALASPFDAQGLRFNMSHSGEVALFAIGWEADLGVDVEAVRAGVDFLGVAAQVFPQPQRSALGRLPMDERQDRFFLLWTLLEACLKAAGTGLTMDPRSIALAPGLDSATTPDLEGVPAATWTLRRLPTGPGYAGALAAGTREPRLALWDWTASPPARQLDLLPG